MLQEGKEKNANRFTHAGKVNYRTPISAEYFLQVLSVVRFGYTSEDS